MQLSGRKVRDATLLTLQEVNGDVYVCYCLNGNERVGLGNIDVEDFEEAVVVGPSKILKQDAALVIVEALNRDAAVRIAVALRTDRYKHFLGIEPRVCLSGRRYCVPRCDGSSAMIYTSVESSVSGTAFTL